MNRIPFYVAGSPEHGDAPVMVRSPYDGKVVGATSMATPDHVERAVAAAEETVGQAGRLPAAKRAAALDHVSRRLAERADEVTALISSESGKPVMWARAEVSRAVSTFRWAAEEALYDSVA